MAAALLPTVLLGVISVQSVRSQAQRASIQGALVVVRVVGFGLDAVLQDARRTLEVIAATPEMAATDWADAGFPDQQRPRLAAMADRYPLFEDLYLLGPRGQPLVAARVSEPSRALEGFSPELADNYGGYLSDVYRAGPRNSPHIFMVVEVRDQALTKRGFLAAEVDLEGLHTGLRQTVGQGGPSLLIVDSQGRPLYPRAAWEEDAQALRRRDPAVDRVLSTLSEGHVIYTDDQGVEYLAVYKSMIGYNRYRGVRWGVILSQRTQEAFAAADLAARNTALIALLCALAVLGLSVPLVRWLSRPLRRLASYARRVGQSGAEEAGPPAPDLQQRTDEIGGLARAMSAMREDLQESHAQLEARHASLRRAERLSSVGFLAAGVAHEINNPLTTILGYGEFLLEDKAPDHPDRASLELIASEAERVREIVRGLLEMSRRRQDREEVDLDSLLRRALTLSRAGLDMDRVAVRVHPPDEEVTLHADRHALLQVIMNLISNAVDALEGRDDPQLWLRWGHRGDQIFLEVEDNGEGMSEEVQQRLFEPFFTTKAHGRGTGLGMAILSRIVQEHQGQIEVHTQPGQGARFTITLPTSAAA